MVINKNENTKTDYSETDLKETSYDCNVKDCTEECTDNNDNKRNIKDSNELQTIGSKFQRVLGYETQRGVKRCVQTCKCDFTEQVAYVSNVLPPSCKIVEVNKCEERCYFNRCKEFCHIEVVRRCENIS